MPIVELTRRVFEQGPEKAEPMVALYQMVWMAKRQTVGKMQPMIIS